MGAGIGTKETQPRDVDTTCTCAKCMETGCMDNVKRYRETDLMRINEIVNNDQGTKMDFVHMGGLDRKMHGPQFTIGICMNDGRHMGNG